MTLTSVLIVLFCILAGWGAGLVVESWFKREEEQDD